MSRRSIKKFREKARDAVAPFNQNDVGMDNPNVIPMFDKHAPIPSDQKALALGMMPVTPPRLYDLSNGDSGCGQTVFRRTHFFYPLGELAPPLFATRAAAPPYALPIGMATYRSEDCRPKFFHISVYGFGVRRPATVLNPAEPLTESEASSVKFESIYTDFGGVFVENTPRFVPSVPTCQVRIMVHDESGQRFFDADVLGNRNFSVYGFGVTVFVLIREGGYEVDFQNPDSIVPLNGGDVGVEDDIIGARIVPIIQNRTENVQNMTIGVSIDPATIGGAPTVVPIPPGAKKVQVIALDSVAAPALWRMQFWYNRIPSTVRPDAGTFEFTAGQQRTTIIDIPNAPAIAFTSINPAMTPATGFSLIFEVEA